MNVRRSWGVFLLMLVIAVCVVTLAAEKPLTEAWNALHGTPDDCEWQCVGAGGSKTAAAAGWQDGRAVLCWFTTDGGKLSRQRISLPDECAGGTITRLLPVREGLAYLGVYGPDAEKLFLFRVAEDGTAERLLAADCIGASYEARTARTKLSELSWEDGVMSFALWTGDALECFRCRETGGLESAGFESVTDARILSVLTAPDGTLLLGGRDCLSLNGESADASAAGKTVTHLTAGRGGCYYIDANTLELCFADGSLGTSFRMLRPDTERNGVQQSVSAIAVTREEQVLMLLDNAILTLTDAEGTRELTGVLRPATFGQWLTLAKFAAIALVGAALLWLLLCGLRRGYASLVVLRGSVFVACALLCLAVLRFAVLVPAAQKEALRDNAAIVSAVLRAADAGQRRNDESLPGDVSRLLDSAGAGSNARVVAATLTDGVWRSPDGRQAAALDGFSPALATAALEDGEANEIRSGMLRCVRTWGTQSLTVCMDVSEAPLDRPLYLHVVLGFGILTLLTLLILLSVRVDVRRISDRMERISRGSVPEPLELRTGDELESMASIVNSLSVSLQAQEEKQKSVEYSYRRFVPEKVLALLGKQSIREVDKSAFAVRRMAVMTVWFAFPETLFTDQSNSRLLFDSVNEVIERMASIVTRKGGTVFHFTYTGFDVVMEDGAEAVSTAVAIQQEVLSFNESRAQSRLPGVTLRIAIDKGSVMLGIVGDTSQMEPTTISASLTTAQGLIGLCNRLKAGILCTESVVSELQEHGSRYMGKCSVGKQLVRVYEVFDGDEFNTRRGKANSVDEFSRGVYDLYSGDVVSAKRTFLQLAHSYPLDGGARYYLHLADRLEHDPSLPCLLDPDKTDGGEM